MAVMLFLDELFPTHELFRGQGQVRLQFSDSTV